MDYLGTVTSVSNAYTGGYPATNQIPVDMHKKTFSAFPQLTPITSMLTKLGEDKARQIRVDWIEENKIPTSVVVAADLAAAGTSLSVATGGITLVKDTILFNPNTWDYATVDSNPTSNTVTITRDVAGSTGAIWRAGDVVHVLPPTVPENDDDTYRPSSVADDNMYNIVQLVKLQYSLSRLMNATSTWHGGPGSIREKLKQQKYREFREKWEKLIYFGARSQTTSSGSHTGIMGGLTHYLRNGKLFKDFGGFLTESGFRRGLGDYKDQNPDTPNATLYCGGYYLDAIDSWAGDKVRLSPDSQTYGMDIYVYNARGLRVNLVPLPLFNDPVTKGFAFLLDLDRMTLKTLESPTFHPEAKNIGMSEKIIDTYRVATSMLIANESRHAMFIGAR